MRKFICMHGHFYQPPRENPWTGEVDEEESASPYHNWNERIAKECYEANTQAPILNSKGEVIEKVNNYSRISFDFGPTLLSWLKIQNPVAYRAIVEADKQSVSKHRGHGNAMAQIYNHVIMPLAKKRDKITQVIWGIKDFEFHFGRKPEGMWLSETAVDRESLQILADQGILFTVLAPHQASRVRRTGFGRRWDYLHHESIDTRVPYRILLREGRHFHIFFYNGSISQSMAFSGLLNNGDQLDQKLLNAFSSQDRPELVSTATDGETFGHHHKFGEMAIAYGLRKIEKQKLAHISNYGEFLETFDSHWEADIHENSSWSCAHGVERWRSDCGCRLHLGAGWNQKWRQFLREGFELVQNIIDDVYEKETGAFLKDPWAARNQYIVVMLDPSIETKKLFISRNAKRHLSIEDEKKLWALLEAEKFSLFMFTSCAWFFDDISGIEPVQMMKYALRAIELVQPHYAHPIEPLLLKILDQAKSNIPEHGTGADVFNKLAKLARPATIRP